jgi:hypothetical protein
MYVLQDSIKILRIRRGRLRAVQRCLTVKARTGSSGGMGLWLKHGPRVALGDTGRVALGVTCRRRAALSSTLRAALSSTRVIRAALSSTEKEWDPESCHSGRCGQGWGRESQHRSGRR